jgi:hypothetical protein
MRRALAAVAVRIATLVGSLALLCFVLLHTVGDPTRPARIADAVLSSSAGQSALTSALADAVRTAAPAGIEPQLAAAVPAQGLSVRVPGRAAFTFLGRIRAPLTAGWRSEERRVGTDRGTECRSRWSAAKG